MEGMKTWKVIVYHLLRGERMKSTWTTTAKSSGHAVAHMFRHNHGKAWFKTLSSIEVSEVR